MSASSNSEDDKTFPLVTIASGGIRDLSPLIPLLGTEQCERLVTSALKRGLLYAAATPMSIFGSLGIAKAGFIVLWTSIDTSMFPGPTLIDNAGFLPSGVGSLLAHVTDNNRHLYVAEDKIRKILARKRVRAVKINMLSKDLVLWNARLVLATVFLSLFGLIPYIFPIARFLSDQPFQATWLFPIMRILGCDVVAITIQFIIQLRILEETYHRIRFMATDSYLKDYGKSLPDYWDPNERSKDILTRFQFEPNVSPSQRTQKHSLDAKTKELLTQNLGTISGFDFPEYGKENTHSNDTHRRLPTPATPTLGHQHSPDINSAEVAMVFVMPAIQMTRMHSLPYIIPSKPPEAYITRVIVGITQGFLLVGLITTVVGYIGCFSIVRAGPSSDWKGPLFWVGFEVLLAMVRTAVWARNPAWDDAKSPIALERVVDPAPVQQGKASETEFEQRSTSYGIGWMLDAVTADDMHALIVGVDDFGFSGLGNLTGCVHDAKLVAGYLEDTLLVPRNQIVKLYNADATKERIIEELKALGEKGTVLDQAPIVIYFATHSLVSTKNKQTYLVPFQGSSTVVDQPNLPPKSLEDGQFVSTLEDTSLSYDSIVDLLGRVSQEKTDNITLILDTCHAGSMGLNNKFDRATQPSTSGSSMSAEAPMNEVGDWPALPRGFKPMSSKTTSEILVGHSSHVLLAGTEPGQVAYEDHVKGGVFTRSLLEVLKSPAAFEKMTYKMLVRKINAKMEQGNFGRSVRDQAALCTSIYQNRLLFNGLLSRRIAGDGGMPVITVQYSNC